MLQEARADVYSKLKLQCMLQDLFHKAQQSPDSRVFPMLAKGLFAVLPERKKEALPEGSGDLLHVQSPVGRAVHGLIVTVLPCERDALLACLNLRNHPSAAKECEVRSGLQQVLECEWRGTGRVNLQLAVACVGRARNVRCAIAVRELMHIYSPTLTVLCGIGAGLFGKTRIGDAVCASGVIDYEHVRSERRKMAALRGKPPKEKRRPLPLDVEDKVFQAVRELDRDAVAESSWRTLREQRTLLPEAGNRSHRRSKVVVGIIMSGDRLLADSSLPEMRNNYSDEVRGADQEASGFAQACKFDGRAWAVCRGVADYGNYEKSNKYHELASIVAATTTLVLLESWMNLNSPV
jgi:nucleoside phosphorylase